MKILNLPPPIDTQNLQLYMEQFNLKTSWATPTHWANEKKPTSNWVVETEYHHKTHHSTAFHNQKGTQNLNLLLEEQRVWPPYWVPQLLKPAPELWAPKTSSFENQWSLHTWDPQDYDELKKQLLKGLCVQSHLPQGPMKRHAIEKHPDFKWKRFICLF